MNEKVGDQLIKKPPKKSLGAFYLSSIFIVPNAY
ncbi:MAG: hypothetical protein RI982_1078 [Bacteroidota bacterium]|jgi:hypothetical protein